MWDYSNDARVEMDEPTEEEEVFHHLTQHDMRVYSFFFRVIGACAATCLYLGIFSLVWAFIQAWEGNLLAVGALLFAAAANFYAADFAWNPKKRK